MAPLIKATIMSMVSCFLKKTHLPEMIERSKCNLKINFETITMKDSLDLTKEDIYNIVNAVKKNKI